MAAEVCNRRLSSLPLVPGGSFGDCGCTELELLNVSSVVTARGARGDGSSSARLAPGTRESRQKASVAKALIRSMEPFLQGQRSPQTRLRFGVARRSGPGSRSSVAAVTNRSGFGRCEAIVSCILTPLWGSGRCFCSRWSY